MSNAGLATKELPMFENMIEQEKIDSMKNKTKHDNITSYFCIGYSKFWKYLIYKVIEKRIWLVVAKVPNILPPFQQRVWHFEWRLNSKSDGQYTVPQIYVPQMQLLQKY